MPDELIFLGSAWWWLEVSIAGIFVFAVIALLKRAFRYSLRRATELSKRFNEYWERRVTAGVSLNVELVAIQSQISFDGVVCIFLTLMTLFGAGMVVVADILLIDEAALYEGAAEFAFVFMSVSLVGTAIQLGKL